MSPSKRKNSADNWLPSRVYAGKSAYEYRPRTGGAVKLHPLGEVTDELKALVWEKYKAATTITKYTVGDLIREFHASPQFARLSKNTRDDYGHYCKRITRVFGAMSPDSVKTPHIRQFMDVLGVDHPVGANRHHSYLSTLFGWGYERGKCAMNPAKGIRKFPETPRERYIEDWEMVTYLKHARKSGSPWMAPAARIAYLCRQRGAELRDITEWHVQVDGMFVERDKGSVNEITRWSDELISAVEEARSIYPDARKIGEFPPLFKSKAGTKFRPSAFKSAHGRIIKACIASGELKEPFHFHDFKAKGITDHTENFGGHKSKKMAAVYNRKPKPQDATR